MKTCKRQSNGFHRGGRGEGKSLLPIREIRTRFGREGHITTGKRDTIFVNSYRGAIGDETKKGGGGPVMLPLLILSISCAKAGSKKPKGSAFDHYSLAGPITSGPEE